MNRYIELRKKHQEETNAFPLGVAFSDSQFEKMMNKWGLTLEDTDKICKLPSVPGVFFRKADIPAYKEMVEMHSNELQQAIDNDVDGTGFIYDMFFAELENHEYCITADWDDTLNALGFTLEKVKADERMYKALVRASDTIIKNYWNTPCCIC